MGGGARDRLRIAERLGIATLDLPFAQSLADVEREHQAAGAARSAGARGGRGAAAADGRAERAARRRRGVDTIWLGGGGRTVSARRAWRRSGWRWPACASAPLQGDRVSLETLIVAAARDPAAQRLSRRANIRASSAGSPIRWRAGARGSRTLATDGRRWTCMGPLLIDEIERLRREAAR